MRLGFSRNVVCAIHRTSEVTPAEVTPAEVTPAEVTPGSFTKKPFPENYVA